MRWEKELFSQKYDNRISSGQNCKYWKILKADMYPQKQGSKKSATEVQGCVGNGKFFFDQHGKTLKFFLCSKNYEFFC